MIVHLYEDLGVDCITRLRGMFGFALWDARRGQLLLARDRLGIKPMHYALGADGLYFGSEQKSILAAGQVEREADVARSATSSTTASCRRRRRCSAASAGSPPVTSCCSAAAR